MQVCALGASLTAADLAYVIPFAQIHDIPYSMLFIFLFDTPSPIIALCTCRDCMPASLYRILRMLVSLQGFLDPPHTYKHCQAPSDHAISISSEGILISSRSWPSRRTGKVVHPWYTPAITVSQKPSLSITLWDHFQDSFCTYCWYRRRS